MWRSGSYGLKGTFNPFHLQLSELLPNPHSSGGNSVVLGNSTSKLRHLKASQDTKVEKLVNHCIMWAFLIIERIRQEKLAKDENINSSPTHQFRIYICNHEVHFILHFFPT